MLTPILIFLGGEVKKILINFLAISGNSNSRKQYFGEFKYQVYISGLKTIKSNISEYYNGLNTIIQQLSLLPLRMNPQFFPHWVENFCNAMMHDNKNYNFFECNKWICVLLHGKCLLNQLQYSGCNKPSLTKQVGMTSQYIFT